MATERILLLMDNRGDSNWGSQATTSALVALLQERFPRAEIRGLPRTACRPSGALRRSLATKLVQSGSRWATRILTNEWRGEFEWADLVVINGEGTLHPQPQAIRWICSVTALAQELSKPYWVVNCSLRCKGHAAEPLFATFFKGAEHVAAREPVSYREMLSIGADAVQAADCAWLTEPADQTEVSIKLATAGVNGAFAVMTGSASVHRWPIEHQCEIIKELRSRGLSVVYTHSDAKDVKNLANLPSDLIVLSHKDLSYGQLTTLQGMSQVVVGGRFHPTILAALQGTPFVAVPSNTHKMSGLMEMLDADELLCDFNSLDRVVPTIRRVLDSREEWSQRLIAKTREIVPLVRLNVKT